MRFCILLMFGPPCHTYTCMCVTLGKDNVDIGILGKSLKLWRMRKMLIIFSFLQNAEFVRTSCIMWAPSRLEEVHLCSFVSLRMNGRRCCRLSMWMTWQIIAMLMIWPGGSCADVIGLGSRRIPASSCEPARSVFVRKLV